MRIYPVYHEYYEYETEDVDLDWILEEFGDIESYIDWECKSENKKKVKQSKKKLINYEIYGATDEEKEKIDRMNQEKMEKELNQIYYSEIKF